MPHSISRVALLCGLLVLTTAAAGGCQRGSTWNLAPVEGTVTKGGIPLRGMQVSFLPDAAAGTVGPRSTGFTDEAGHYRLRTDNGDEGAVIGKHRISVLDPKAAASGMSRSAPRPQQKEVGRLPPEMAKRLEEQQKTAGAAPRVPPSYGLFNETPLRAEIHPGSQTLNFDIP